MATTVALCNLKGGVGKTSSTYHLGGMLAASGRRVLLVDADPQASLTQGFYGPAATRGLTAEESIAALFDAGRGAVPAALVRDTGVPGLDLVAGSRHLTRANMLPPEEWAEHEESLRELVAELGDGYDLVLVDCPPNLHLLAWTAMVAADRVVTPLQPEDFGSQGLAPVQEAIAAVQAGPNPELRLAGYLLTMVDKRLTVHATYEGLLRELYGEAVFANVIPRAKDFVEAVAGRQTIAQYKPRSAAARAAKAVAEELVTRCAGAIDEADERRAA